MNLSKFLDLTNSHVLDLHSSTLQTWIPYFLISLCNASLLGDEERKDRYPHMSHHFISSHHTFPVCYLTPTTPVSSISSPGVCGVFTGFLSLRGSSVLQHPFRNRLTQVWLAIPLKQHCRCTKSSSRALSTHCLCIQTADLPAQGHHSMGQSTAKMFTCTFIWLILLIQDLLGI